MANLSQKINLEVNGIDLAGKSLEEVVSQLRSTKMEGTVSLLVFHKKRCFPPKGTECRAKLNSDSKRNKAEDEGVPFTPNRTREFLMFEVPLNDSGSAVVSASKVTSQNSSSCGFGIFVKSTINGVAAVSKDGRLWVNQ